MIDKIRKIAENAFEKINECYTRFKKVVEK